MHPLAKLFDVFGVEHLFPPPQFVIRQVFNGIDQGAPGYS